MRKLLRFFTSNVFIIGLLIAVQFLFLMWLIMALSEYYIWIYSVLMLLSIIIAIYVVNKGINPAYKITWIFLILSFPLVGGVIYLMFGGQKMPKELVANTMTINKDMRSLVSKELPTTELDSEQDADAHRQSMYIKNASSFPLYEHTQTRFLATGEEKFEVMLEELKKAEKYIFLEYFIIMEGVMWDTILEVLVEKVKQGVEVRVLYDDAGCIQTLPANYDKKLRALGIKVKVFNRLRALLAIQMNNRDHRKIMVVDGKVGITGGINLSDEYINVRKLHGHWKDSSVLLEGAAVFSLLALFLQFWNYGEKPENKEETYDYYLGTDFYTQYENDGFVQPFGDSPTDEENVGENTHLNIINSAKKYVYIQTPYLIIDNEMRTSLCLAAKSGVDVRIVVPHIPDKKTVYELTKSNFEPLLKSGVRIYEYTPGFIHAKTLVSDDHTAIIGTINMDYRSYFLHFECGVWFYKSRCVQELKEDNLRTLAQSHEIYIEDIENIKWYRKVFWAVINLFAPLA